MAITQYTEPATTNPTLTDWQSSIARDNASSRGFAEVDLDDYADGATAPKVAVGSRFDNNGALYVVATADESIGSIAGIANSTTFYVYYDISEGVFLASTTTPTFDKEKRGWYNGNDRALFRIYKDSGGEYDDRCRLTAEAKEYNDSERFFNATFSPDGAEDSLLSFGNSSASAAIIPHGIFYYVVSNAAVDVTIEAFINGSWQDVTTGLKKGFVIGNNRSVRVYGSLSSGLYLLRL